MKGLQNNVFGSGNDFKIKVTTRNPILVPTNKLTNSAVGEDKHQEEINKRQGEKV